MRPLPHGGEPPAALPPPPRPTGPSTRLRRIGGLGAAVAATPYLLVKTVWSFGLLVPTREMAGADWRAVNAATGFLAAVGIVLATAFSRPWGERLPAWTVVLPVWVGTGFLVPVLLLAPVLGPAAVDRDRRVGPPDFWVYEQVLVMVSLVGVGIGLPLALVGYVRARWPEALTGPLAHPEPVGGTRRLQVPLARLVAAGCVLLGCVKVFWAAGGVLGLDAAALDRRDPWWHLLSLSTAGWAFAGAWGVLVVTARRGTRRFLPPLAVTWVSSGALFSYGVYDLLTLTGMQRPSPELPLAGALAREGGVVLGVVMGLVLLLVLHDRGRAPRGPG
ncbi:hypothetical protein M4914_23065 [Streptomyces somaliensis DSM 40738]|uniref:hypothetical protein n=1 Tax=Streptomyces somaliensis TaxID=78355 RepID=UPI0021C32EB9|nr:hypothetical protein [Streptomyces somaliensis]MCQ0025530.1 hypothetical protein [Streptomyces somaliensis DSM 40738]